MNATPTADRTEWLASLKVGDRAIFRRYYRTICLCEIVYISPKRTKIEIRVNGEGPTIILNKYGKIFSNERFGYSKSIEPASPKLLSRIANIDAQAYINQVLRISENLEDPEPSIAMVTALDEVFDRFPALSRPQRPLSFPAKSEK